MSERPVNDEWRIPRAVWVAGVAIGVSAFLVFEWFFVPPRGSLSIANPIDGLFLLPFVVAAVLLTQYVRGAGARRRRSDADPRKDALLASVSHDLRTPLTTIKALAHELGALGDERSQVIAEQADRLNRYVEQLLDLSRLTAGEMPVRIEVNALDDLLSAVVEETEGRLGGRALTVSVEETDSLLVGRFDLLLSVRILANLVENAHKYSPAGTAIEVRSTAAHRMLRIAVMDRGPGVAPTEQSRIFADFYRPKDAPPDAGSAGLGLAVARRMAELQGGRLLYADREGGGSEFALLLPAAGLSDTSRAEEAARDFAGS